MKSCLVILLSTLILSACKNPEKDAKAFETVLENSSGQNFTLVKYYTEISGYRVFKNEVTGEYSAYNLSDFDRKKMKTMDSYLAAAGESSVVRNLEMSQEWVVDGHWYEDSSTTTSCDSEGQNCYDTTTTWTTDTWVDDSRFITYYSGGGFKFDNSISRSHDLETLAALEEQVAVKMISNTLSSNYSLSSNRAAELASLSYRYKKMENIRELTTDEKDLFSLKALGVSMNEFEKTLKDRANGNDRGYQDLLAKAAMINRTTPEQIGNFFEDFLIEE